MRAEQWLAALGDKPWVARIDEEAPNEGLVAYCHFNSTAVCAADDADRLFIYLSSSRARHISVGFEQIIGPSTALATLQSSFRYLSLDHLPLDGLVVPGWSVYPQTPASSFKEGVEIVAFEAKRLGIRARTRFFAIYGQKLGKDCEPIPDAPSPPRCHFQVERDFAGDITIALPIFARPLPPRER